MTEAPLETVTRDTCHHLPWSRVTRPVTRLQVMSCSFPSSSSAPPLTVGMFSSQRSETCVHKHQHQGRRAKKFSKKALQNFTNIIVSLLLHNFILLGALFSALECIRELKCFRLLKKTFGAKPLVVLVQNKEIVAGQNFIRFKYQSI